MEPQTIWRPTDGNSEFSVTGNPNIDTESGLDLITQSSLNLVTEDSSATLIPSTVWAEDQSM